MSKEKREKIVFSRDDQTSRIIIEDLFTVIGVGQNVQDIVEGDPVPDEMLSVEEVSLLWSYLPENRRPELDPHIEKFLGSINNPPSDFNGWLQQYRSASLHSFELSLAVLMMASLAVSFREWLIVFSLSEDKQIKLKRTAATMMLQLAASTSEHNVAKRKYKEANQQEVLES